MQIDALYQRIEKIREWIESNDCDRAKAELRAVYPLVQGNGSLLGFVARLLLRVGATGAAVKACRRGARLAPRNGVVQTAAFDILWSVGMRSEALERQRQIWKCADVEESTLMRSLQIFSAAGHLKEGLPVLVAREQTLTVSVEVLEKFWTLALEDGTYALCEELSELASRKGPAGYALACQIHLSLGDASGALECLQRDSQGEGLESVRTELARWSREPTGNSILDRVVRSVAAQDFQQALATLQSGENASPESELWRMELLRLCGEFEQSAVSLRHLESKWSVEPHSMGFNRFLLQWEQEDLDGQMELDLEALAEHMGIAKRIVPEWHPRNPRKVRAIRALFETALRRMGGHRGLGQTFLNAEGRLDRLPLPPPSILTQFSQWGRRLGSVPYATLCDELKAIDSEPEVARSFWLAAHYGKTDEWRQGREEHEWDAIAPEWRAQVLLQRDEGAGALEIMGDSSEFPLLRAHALWLLDRREDCAMELEQCDSTARATLRFRLLQFLLDPASGVPLDDLKMVFPAIALLPTAVNLSDCEWAQELLRRLAGCGCGDMESLRTPANFPLVILPG